MNSKTASIEQVPAAGWREWSDRTKGVIVDVREAWEWQSTGVIPGSETISLGNLQLVADRFDRGTPLLLVCQSGNRSMTAAHELVAAGFRNLANLAGGIAALAY